MSEILTKWEKVINGICNISDISKNNDWSEFIASMIESQYLFNKLIYEGKAPSLQNYSLPIICHAFREISQGEFPKYLKKQNYSKHFNSSRLISLDIPTDITVEVENIIMDDLKNVIKKHLQNKIYRGSFKIGPIINAISYGNGKLECEISV